MSASVFPRILYSRQQLRSYSSFFSNKSGGGGRYFNSAKPPKPVAPVTSSSKSAPKPDSSTNAASDSKDQSSKQSSLHPANSNQQLLSSATSSSEGDLSSSPSPSPSSHSLFLHTRSHPVVHSKDLQLHQFFSLHRPLLLLSDPASILHSAPLDNPLFPAPTSITESLSADVAPGSDPLFFDHSSLDADAEAARQLTRALTMSRAGSTVAWENTLRRLGLDVNAEAERVGLMNELEKEWQDVVMDSTKRKRKKKMKKHKLKKRRKATRATRLKIGRS